MPAERRKLARLQRLERIRAIARAEAAEAAARAEETLAQLQSLAERTGALASDYALRSGPATGAELARTASFTAGLLTIRAQALADAARAESHADHRQRALAEAERRRAAVEDRAEATRRAIARAGALPALGARRASGTGLE